jgi:hypothetical protein
VSLRGSPQASSSFVLHRDIPFKGYFYCVKCSVISSFLRGFCIEVTVQITKAEKHFQGNRATQGLTETIT